MNKKLKLLIFKFWLKSHITPEPNLIFLISHMRSGSTLLEHILSSNNQILGFGEQSRVYTKKSDFKKMELFIRWNQKKIFKYSKYVVDQILHNKYTPNIDFLINHNVKFIFLARSPIETISSIENLGSHPYSKANRGLYNSIDYYINRLVEIISMSKIIPVNRQFFLTYTDLTEKTDQTLLGISEFLELKTTLKKDYKLKRSTGHLGDKFENIKKGTIILTQKKLTSLSDKSIKKMNLVYIKTIKHFNFIKC
ncbi:sulfotransferase family protein [Flavobacteriaceae bacterium LMO-SS05]